MEKQLCLLVEPEILPLPSVWGVSLESVCVCVCVGKWPKDIVSQRLKSHSQGAKPAGPACRQGLSCFPPTFCACVCAHVCMLQPFAEVPVSSTQVDVETL